MAEMHERHICTDIVGCPLDAAAAGDWSADDRNALIAIGDFRAIHSVHWEFEWRFEWEDSARDTRGACGANGLEFGVSSNASGVVID